jgi:hypothetical protein
MAARFEFWCREAVLPIQLCGHGAAGHGAAGRCNQPTDQIRRGLEHPVEPAVGVQRGVEGCRQGTGRQAKAILRELNRYPPQAIRLSQPLPGDSWGRPEARAVLPPAEKGSRFQLSALRRPLGATGATVVDGPEAAPVTLLLAHGAGAAMDTPSWRPWPAGWPGPAGVWCALGSPPWLGCGRRGDARGLTGCRCCRRRLRQQVQLDKTEQPGRLIVIGGKSMVGRVASLLVDELAASDGVWGCLCLGYPFNPPGSSGHWRRWRAMPSQPRFSCSGSAAATTASSPPRAWASARRGTGPRPLITLTAFCGNT